MRKLMIFALPFGAGALLGVCLLPAAALPWAALAALALGWGTAALLKPRRRQIRTGTAGLVCGLLWLALYSFWVLAPAENLVGTEDRVTVELLDYAEASDYGARAEVRVLD
ncbi:MAG: DNA internalization-related competence protein ComEC/Rec2, partial [Oscillospiraceae bacterium]|nr:DNA internalization-related competence protein ComEC/Rec2 [Oscillospiraceae bacterium]